MGELSCQHDLDFIESINKEIPHLAGIEVEFYELQQIPSKVDPLYRQPVTDTDWNFVGPYLIEATVEKPIPAFMANDEGATREDKTRVTFSRLLIEETGMPYPEKGDLVKFWGVMFTVVAVEDTGPFWQSGRMVNTTVDLIRHSEYIPERKIRVPVTLGLRRLRTNLYAGVNP